MAAPALFDFSEPPEGRFWALREAPVGNTRISYGIQSKDEGGVVKLYSLRTPLKHRGNGYARKAMVQFLAEADLAGKVVQLDASPLDAKTNLEKLVQFYRSFGFQLTGRSVNAAGDPSMERPLQKPQASRSKSCNLNTKDEKMSQPKATITPEVREGDQLGKREIFVIRRDGNFVIGGSTQLEAEKYFAALESNNWTHLDCYDRGHPDPLEWIAHVRSKGCTFESFSSIEIGANGNVFFAGNLNEVSAAFRYLILDEVLTDKIIQAAPELPVVDYRIFKRIREAATECLVECGWTPTPLPGISLASKDYETAVGMKGADVYFSDAGRDLSNFRLFAYYYSEGRNILEPLEVIIPRVASKEEVIQLASDLVSQIDAVISQSYAAKLSKPSKAMGM